MHVKVISYIVIVVLSGIMTKQIWYQIWIMTAKLLVKQDLGMQQMYYPIANCCMSEIFRKNYDALLRVYKQYHNAITNPHSHI